MRSLSFADQFQDLTRVMTSQAAARIEQRLLADIERERAREYRAQRRSGTPSVSDRILLKLGDGMQWRGTDLLVAVGGGSKGFYGALGTLITAGRVERAGKPYKYLYRLA